MTPASPAAADQPAPIPGICFMLYTHTRAHTRARTHPHTHAHTHRVHYLELPRGGKCRAACHVVQVAGGAAAMLVMRVRGSVQLGGMSPLGIRNVPGEETARRPRVQRLASILGT